METTPKKEIHIYAQMHVEGQVASVFTGYHMHSAPSPLGRPQKRHEKQLEKYSP